MKKFLLVALLLGLFGVALTGCRAEGEIETHDSTRVVAPR